jgi:hypothetical protein
VGGADAAEGSVGGEGAGGKEGEGMVVDCRETLCEKW